MRTDSCIVDRMSVTTMRTMAEWQMVASRVAAVAEADSVAIVADSQSCPGLYWAHNQLRLQEGQVITEITEQQINQVGSQNCLSVNNVF